MPLSPANDVPEPNLRIIGEHLSGLFRSEAVEVYGALDRQNPSVTAPQRVFVADLSTAKNREALTNTKFKGWRYILCNGHQPQMSLEIDSKNGRSEFSHASQGPRVQESIAALHTAESLPAILRGDYEARYFKVPGLSVTAVWLFDKAPKQEHFFIPLAALEPLVSGRVYNKEEFAGVLAEMATTRLQSEERP